MNVFKFNLKMYSAHLSSAIGTASSNSEKVLRIRPRMYTEYLL